MPFVIDLTGRRALVTGASMGIGAATARMLAQAGCDVAGCGLEAADSEKAQRFIASVEAEGCRACYEQVDLRDPAAPARWAVSAIEALGGVDIVVSNAGREAFATAAECSEETWLECMNLNLAGHWRVARAARPFLERGTGPVVIAISSVHAYATLPGRFPYNVAKAGLIGLVKSLALEWGPRIRAVGIAPGIIVTEGAAEILASFPEPDAVRAHFEQLHPVGRAGRPEDIGALCVFLASSWSGFITGVTFLVDGGNLTVLRELTPELVESLLPHFQALHGSREGHG